MLVVIKMDKKPSIKIFIGGLIFVIIELTFSYLIFTNTFSSDVNRIMSLIQILLGLIVLSIGLILLKKK